MKPNPKKNRDERRTRPSYPNLTPGQAVLLDREECGTNRPVRFPKLSMGLDGSTITTYETLGQLLVGSFVFRRHMHPAQAT